MSKKEWLERLGFEDICPDCKYHSDVRGGQVVKKYCGKKQIVYEPPSRLGSCILHNIVLHNLKGCIHFKRE